MIEIKKAAFSDIPILTKLAEEIWWPTYKTIISEEQIAFMLGEMYSAEALTQQIQNRHQFLILEVDGIAKGFASFSKLDGHTYKLQKLYLHPNQQGNGNGKLLISSVETEVLKLNGKTLILNVNRGNRAHLFYTKMGYKIVEEIDIVYHQFVLNDYVMIKNLS